MVNPLEIAALLEDELDLSDTPNIWTMNDCPSCDLQASPTQGACINNECTLYNEQWDSTIESLRRIDTSKHIKDVDGTIETMHELSLDDLGHYFDGIAKGMNHRWVDQSSFNSIEPQLDHASDLEQGGTFVFWYGDKDVPSEMLVFALAEKGWL